MNDQNSSAGSSVLQLFFYWAVVGIPLAWGVYKTVLKLPALFH